MIIRSDFFVPISSNTLLVFLIATWRKDQNVINVKYTNIQNFDESICQRGRLLV